MLTIFPWLGWFGLPNIIRPANSSRELGNGDQGNKETGIKEGKIFTQDPGIKLEDLFVLTFFLLFLLLLEV